MKKFVRKYGILFWITGLSGSGKSSIGKNIFSSIRKKFGPTIILHGDNLRKAFDLRGYSRQERIQNGKKYIKFIRLITKQNVNVILTIVGLFKELRILNRKIFDNYVEIYVKTSLKNIIKKNKKRLYKNKKNNVVGLNIKAEYPKKYDILIKNDFSKDINFLSNKVLKNIFKKFSK